MTDLANFASVPSNPALAIRRNVLQAGRVYEFSVSVRAKGSVSDASGMAFAQIVVNGPPLSGTCAAVPAVGVSTVTKFELRCEDWADDADDFPFQYAFHLEKEGVWAEIGQMQGAASIPAEVLPPGPEESDYMHTIRASIADKSGAVSYYTFQVQVLDPQIPASEWLSLVQTLIDGPLSVSSDIGDTNQFSQALYTSTAILDKLEAGARRDTQLQESILAARKSLIFAVEGMRDNTLQVSTETVSQQMELTLELCSTPDEIDDEAAQVCADSASDAVTRVNSRANQARMTDAIGLAVLNIYDAALNAAGAAQTGRALLEANSTTSALSNMTSAFTHAVSALSQSAVEDMVVGEDAHVLETDHLYLSSSLQEPGALVDQPIAGAGAQVSLPSAVADVLLAVGATRGIGSTYFVHDTNLYAHVEPGIDPTWSPVVSLSLFDPQFEPGTPAASIHVANLTEEIEISIQHGAGLGGFEVPVCRYWKEQEEAWSTDGCRVESRLANGSRVVPLAQADVEAVYDSTVEDPGPTWWSPVAGVVGVLMGGAVALAMTYCMFEDRPEKSAWRS
jgi:hypothetical protein